MINYIKVVKKVMYIGQIIFPTTRWYFYNVIEIEFTQTINSSSI